MHFQIVGGVDDDNNNNNICVGKECDFFVEKIFLTNVRS